MADIPPLIKGVVTPMQGVRFAKYHFCGIMCTKHTAKFASETIMQGKPGSVVCTFGKKHIMSCTSFMTTVNNNVESCAVGAPGAITVSNYTGRIIGGSLAATPSQCGVWGLNQVWSAFYAPGTTFSHTDVKTNLGTDDTGASKAMIFMGAFYDTHGTQIAGLNAAAATITDNVDPDDKKEPS